MKQFYDMKKAAEALGISMRQLYRTLDKVGIKPFQVGYRKCFVKISDIDALIKSRNKA